MKQTIEEATESYINIIDNCLGQELSLNINHIREGCIEIAKSEAAKEYWFNKFLSKNIELPFNKEVHFMGKGNHSVETLEEICKYYKELIYQLRLKEKDR